jgi:hypothetical protein
VKIVFTQPLYWLQRPPKNLLVILFYLASDCNTLL